MRTHIALDLEYATAEDRTISAVWRALFGMAGRDVGGSLFAFEKMWRLIHEIATTDDLAAESALGAVEVGA